MKVIRRYFLTALLLIIFLLPGISQSDDFGVWYGISTSISVTKKLDLEFQTQLRTFENATKIDEGNLEGGIEYKWSKDVSFALNYRISEVCEKDLDYHIRHKWFADIKAEHKTGDIDLSGRFRFQRQDKTFFDSESDKIPDYHGRIRLKVEYKTPSFPLNPYLYVESFIRMFEYSDRRNDKNKFSAGVTYKIANNQSVDAEYIFMRDYEPHLSDINLIAIEYKLKFK